MKSKCYLEKRIFNASSLSFFSMTKLGYFEEKYNKLEEDLIFSKVYEIHCPIHQPFGFALCL